MKKLMIDPGTAGRRNKNMGHSATERFGALPSAVGTITRLAYARAKTSGIDTQALLKKANLTLQNINDTSLRLRVSDQINFLYLVARALGDDLFGFHLAQSPDLREFGFLYYVAASSETLGQALQKLARYTTIANEGVSLTYLDGKNVGVKFHYVGVGRHLDRHQIEFFMTWLIRLCRQLTGVRLVPTRVRFAHRRGVPCPELSKFFGGDVKFTAAVDEVAFTPTIKNMPVVSADNYLSKFLTAYCEEALGRRPNRRHSFRSSVENAVVPLLPHGDAKLPAIASRLGLSPRTFARRLATEGLNFSDILESLKVNLARRYMADSDLSISQVAWLLGYLEASAFTHAFKRWTGMTPRQARLQVASRYSPVAAPSWRRSLSAK
jgi:AraC-like DNA-binding protein